MAKFKKARLVQYIAASRPLQALMAVDILLLISCVLLAAVPPAQTVTLGQSSDERTPEFPLMDRRDLDLIATEERPIFHESRKPREAISQKVVAVAPPTQPQTPNQVYRLTGIMDSASGQRVAYVLLLSAQQTMKVQVGENLGEWLVKNLTRTSMNLEKGGETFELKLAQ